MSEIPEAPDLPNGFRHWAGLAKQQWIREHVCEATEYSPVDRPDLQMTPPWTMASIAMSPSTLVRTLDRTDDVMESERPKIIHTHGVVAMVELTTTSASPFTGVLGPDQRIPGLVRISLAVPPQGKGSITPGMGLKLFIDGAPSLDLLAMNHTVGQGRDFNLFSNTFTHDLRDEHEELRPPQKIMSFFFKRVTSQPRRLTIDHLAATRPDGEAVANPVVPTRLVFRPDGAVRRVYHGKHGHDFRDPLLEMEIESPSGKPVALWSVEAVDAGPEGEPLTIGTLTMTSRFTASRGGDRLFFRHHVSPEDRLV